MLTSGMTSDDEAKFIISSARRQGQPAGFLNHNGDLVEEPQGAVSYGFEAAQEAATAFAARSGQGAYILPLLFGVIDVDAEPIYVGPSA